ncbi:alpha 1,2-mannosyltransferase 2.4.1 [Apophysomyces sp. BC1034]|nr:alpha 1,2-mannosyltransferase 2.4.1 [Apophysomyces sp. BC1015]KAG0181436.1 alpha 1,2-mannosyltransferase 2.4.1 [Apophysomyces sp. BC1021]KAG0191900.1 alpha 1,2-mannosyltransferase 2.4.1 [Apophysomyces sp. BC1034]
MSKRRQTLGIQMIAALTLFMTIAYLLTPSSDPLSRDGKPHGRVKAAFVVLVRNSDFDGIRASIRQMEDRFNRKFHYPYVFLNDDDFTEEFKTFTSSLTEADTFYGKVEESMWGYPSFINQTYAAECREDMARREIIYGGSESYRHMCRRLEPEVNYFCDIDYDVFQMMKDNGYKYGWTISLTEYMNTIPTLWDTAVKFWKKYPDYVVLGKDSLMQWLTDDDFETYNGCHFWSNFEIGSLDFLRSEKYIKFFEHLDETGGFFYERWGDAPVHSLAVASMLRRDEVHFFNDIGYKHNPLMHCPTETYLQKNCHCPKQENFGMNSLCLSIA